ncbi:MAG: hypothetical protein QNK11_07010, partial [Legionella sp.]|nr:hypothetical protein [Legionella sp.]
IFDTPEGKQLAVLIQSLMDDVPENRLSVKEARKTLKQIGDPPVRESSHVFECASLLEEIASHRVSARGVKDTQMDTFLNKHYAKLNYLNTEEAFKKVKTELEGVLNGLKEAQPKIDEIERLMKPINGVMKMGMKEKRKKIRRTICAVSLENRAKIENQETVLDALGEHRNPFRAFIAKFYENYKKAEMHVQFKAFKANHLKQDNESNESKKNNNPDSPEFKPS